MTNETKQTAVEWLVEHFQKLQKEGEKMSWQQIIDITKLSKEMEKEQTGYSKEDVLKAGDIGEVNHHDYKHIVKLLDEAKEINKSLKQGGDK